jgi:hypothetical protein
MQNSQNENLKLKYAAANAAQALQELVNALDENARGPMNQEQDFFDPESQAE